MQSDELLKLILKIEKRPALYIGNTDLKCLSHFLNGYIFAKRTSAENNFEILVSDFGEFLECFRMFLVKKYNDNRSYNWAGLIIANEQDGNSTDTFYRLLHEYLETRTE